MGAVTVWVLERGECHEGRTVFGVFATEAAGIAGAQAHMSVLDKGRGSPALSLYSTEWRDEGASGATHYWERVYVGQAERYPRPDCLYVSLTEWPVA